MNGWQFGTHLFGSIHPSRHQVAINSYRADYWVDDGPLPHLNMPDSRESFSLATWCNAPIIVPRNSSWGTNSSVLLYRMKWILGAEAQQLMSPSRVSSNHYSRTNLRFLACITMRDDVPARLDIFIYRHHRVFSPPNPRKLDEANPSHRVNPVAAVSDREILVAAVTATPTMRQRIEWIAYGLAASLLALYNIIMNLIVTVWVSRQVLNCTDSCSRALLGPNKRTALQGVSRWDASLWLDQQQKGAHPCKGVDIAKKDNADLAADRGCRKWCCSAFQEGIIKEIPSSGKSVCILIFSVTVRLPISNEECPKMNASISQSVG